MKNHNMYTRSNRHNSRQKSKNNSSMKIAENIINHIDTEKTTQPIELNPIQQIINKNRTIEKTLTDNVFFVYYGHSGVDINVEIPVPKNQVFITFTDLGRATESKANDKKLSQILNNRKDRELLSKPLTNYFNINKRLNDAPTDNSEDNNNDIRIKIENQTMYLQFLTYISDHEIKPNIYYFRKSGLYKYSTTTTNINEQNTPSFHIWIKNSDKTEKITEFDMRIGIPLTVIIYMYKHSVLPTIGNVLRSLIMDYNYKLINPFLYVEHDFDGWFISASLNNSYFKDNIQSANKIIIQFTDFNNSIKKCISTNSPLNMYPNGQNSIFYRTDILFNPYYNVLYIPTCRTIVNVTKTSLIKPLFIARTKSYTNHTHISNFLNKNKSSKNNHMMPLLNTDLLHKDRTFIVYIFVIWTKHLEDYIIMFDDIIKDYDANQYKKYKCKLLIFKDECKAYYSVKRLVPLLTEYITEFTVQLRYCTYYAQQLIIKLIKLYNKWHYIEIKNLLLDLIKIIKENQETLLEIKNKYIKEYFDTLMLFIKSSLRIEDTSVDSNDD